MAPPPPCELEVPRNAFGQVVVTENVHKVAALLMLTLVPGANSALGKVGFQGCKHLRACVALLISPKASHTHTHTHTASRLIPASQPDPQHLADCPSVPRRLHSQEGGLSWELQPQETWRWGDYCPKVSEDLIPLGPLVLTRAQQTI